MYMPFKDEILEAISKVIESENLSSLHGTEVRKFEKKIAKIVGTKYAVAVNSGTSALHLALKGLLIRPGDEVIVPNLTFMATASAVKMCGAKPILVDTIKDGYSINPVLIRRKITDKTKAIIAVHLAGIPALMDKINEIAMEYNVAVVEDACQALGSEYLGTPVGNWSDVGCFSFYGSKIIPIGEGGMLVTNDPGIYQMAYRLRNHGRVAQKQRIGFIGYNYRMPEVCGAIGNVVVRHFDYLKDWYRGKHKIMAEVVWSENKPRIPEGSDIISTYIPRIHSEDLKIRKFYKPLNSLFPFFSDESFPCSTYMWKRTEKIWLD